MSQRNSVSKRSGDVVQKQPLNVYTVMLIIAFVALSIACLLLYLELNRWGSFPWWKAESGAAMLPIQLHDAVALLAPGRWA